VCNREREREIVRKDERYDWRKRERDEREREKERDREREMRERDSERKEEFMRDGEG
jgi:hypothetical protein